MNGKGIVNVAAAIVSVALVTTIVSRSTSASVITAAGNAFSGAIKAAMGR